MKKTIKGFKAFNADLTCRGFQFKLGQDFTTTTEKKDLKTCEAGGFHFCESLGRVYEYYPLGSVVAEVEAFGDVVTDGDKSVTNGLRLLRILDAEKEARANTGVNNSGYVNSGNRNSGNWNSGNWNSGDRNSGDWNSGNRNSGNRNSGDLNSGDLNSGDWNSGDLNSGDWNSGDWNSGDLNSGDWNSGNRNSGNRNSGDWNSGNWNSGNRNSGNWNSGDWNSGDLNSGTPYFVLVFNKAIETKIWNNISKPSWMYFEMIIWVEFSEMTDEEKVKYPKADVTGGYLKTLTRYEAWKRAYENASKSQIEATKKLPNFDAKIFKEISGLDI